LPVEQTSEENKEDKKESVTIPEIKVRAKEQTKQNQSNKVGSQIEDDIGNLDARISQDEDFENKEGAKDDEDWDKFQNPFNKRQKVLERKSRSSHSVHCPYFSEDKQEFWWVCLTDKKTQTILTAPFHVTNLVDKEEILMAFTAPVTPGLYKLTLCVRSDSYLGLDQFKDFTLDVKRAPEPPKNHPQYDFSSDEDEKREAAEFEYATDTDDKNEHPMNQNNPECYERFKKVVRDPATMIRLGNIDQQFKGKYDATQQFYHEYANFDPYNIFGIDIGASNAEIKTAYKTKALVYHPDKETWDEILFMNLTKAYKALTDVTAKRNREQYRDPDVKSRALIQAHLSGLSLNPQTLEKDRIGVIRKCPTLIQDMCVCFSHLMMLAHAGQISKIPHLFSLENATKFCPMIFQAPSEHKNPLLQLPHIDEDILKYISSKYHVKTLDKLVRLDEGDKKNVSEA
ncbi:hypothetical protein QYM36_006953, partial [Artemia franciscana]